MVSTPTVATRRPTLGERLRALDRDEFVDLCAALWAARGYTIRRVDGRFVASRSDDHLVVLPRADPGLAGATRAAIRSRVSPTGSVDGSDVDLVVTPVDTPWATRLARRHGARLVGPAELTRLLLYGVPRATADELASQYFGLSTVSEAVATDATTSSVTAGSRRPALLVVAGVVCLVLAAVVAGVWTPDPEITGVPESNGGTGPSGDAPAPDTPMAGTVIDETAGTRTASATTRHPPGVERDSVDVATLADAHAGFVSGRSYRLIVRQSGTDALDGSRRWDGVWQHAVVAGPRTWLFVVVGYDAVDGESRLVQYTAYADGEFVYRRTNSNEAARYDRYPARVMPQHGFGTQAVRAHDALTRYLATTEVRIDRPSWRPDLFRVVATGRPTGIDGPVSNYTATAFVSEAGFVSELTVEYTRHVGDGTESAAFRFEYAAVDETTINPPGWYDEARAETAANATSD